MASARSDRILGFDGLRALCVVAVFLSHKFSPAFHASAMAVWVFLALSGFLLIGELHRARLDVEASRCGAGTALRVFLVKRALRIFPAYYGLLALLFLGRRLYGPPGTDLGFAWHASYLSNYFTACVDDYHLSPFGVLWTLSVEQQFYLLAPLAFVLCPTRWHGRACVGVALAAAAGHLLMQRQGASAWTVYLTSPWNFALIALGGLAGILTRAERHRAGLRGPLPLLTALAAVAAYGATWLTTRASIPVGGVSTIAVGLALALLVAWIRCNQDSRVVGMLEWPPLASLGVVSYGFYLVHNFVPSRAIPGLIGLGAHPIPGMIVGAAISFAVSVLIAHLSWRFYEKPILGLRARLLPRGASRPPTDRAAPSAGAGRAADPAAGERLALGR